MKEIFRVFTQPPALHPGYQLTESYLWDTRTLPNLPAWPARFVLNIPVLFITSRGNARKKIFLDDTRHPRLGGGAARMAVPCLLKVRNAAMERAYREYGYTQAEIACTLDLHYATVSRLIKAGKDKMAKGKM
ncbi:MAG TPA: hypothetical protein VK138_04535 [Acidiferrobacterales bacterium]|nr:hypothetical protein [Acidiferrobacterales bacterium]